MPFATLADGTKLVQSSKDLDKDVAEATEKRNEVNGELTETMAADSAAEEPLQSAKNWLNIFCYENVIVLVLVLVLVLVQVALRAL